MSMHTRHALALALGLALASAGQAQAANTQHPAVGRALGHADANPAQLRRAAGDQFVARDVVLDADGTEHVRFDRTWRGMPVIGGDVVVHSRGGRFRSASLTLKSSNRPAASERIGSDEAEVIAGVAFGSDFEGVQRARKVVYARGAEPRLAWEVVFTGTRRDQTPTEMHYFVDAASGRILDKWDMVHTAKPGGGGGGGGAAVGTGRSLMHGTVTLNTSGSAGSFNMTDATRGGGATYDANGAAYSMAARRATLFTDADNTWGNGSMSDRATVAADAHYGVATTFDYFKDVHGRNGIFGDGKGVKSYVHVGNGWVNAAWYQNAMYYGDGGGGYLPLVSLDIAGHEMSHGVTQAVAGLVYSGESGGLNEATSDIFGTMVEYYANNAADAPDYKVGEKIYTNGTSALRYMYKPSLDGKSPDCWASSLGSLDVHYSSGVGNHFFFLLAEGANAPAGSGLSAGQLVCNGNTALNAVGRSAAERIWFRALNVYMTSSTNYAGARAATLSAASDLFGAGSAQQAAVAAAWSAVGVN